jgi:hypothetical protein
MKDLFVPERLNRILTMGDSPDRLRQHCEDSLVDVILFSRQKSASSHYYNDSSRAETFSFRGPTRPERRSESNLGGMCHVTS